MGGHLTEVSGFYGTDDIRADMQSPCHGDEVYPLALPGVSQPIPI